MPSAPEHDPRFRPVDEDDDDEAIPDAGGRALRQAGPAGRGGADGEWQRQTARLERLRRQLQDLDTLEQAQREARASELHPLQQELGLLQRALVRGLEPWLADKALSQRQRAVARERLCVLAQALADAGDAEMRELHDRYSTLGWAGKREAAAQALRQRLEAHLGQVLDLGTAPLTPEAVWATAQARLREAEERQRERREARQEKRQQKRQARQPGAGVPSDTTLAEAEQLLRRLYRQLASHLHPDRAAGDADRVHRTARMGQVNAAYEARDLTALLRLQAEVVPPASDAKQATGPGAAAMLALLRQQAAALERQRAARQAELAHRFSLPPGQAAQPATLAADLAAKRQALASAIEGLRADLRRLDDPPALRRWLKDG